MKKLIIAEKQSVGKTIAKALGISGDSNDYIEGGEYIISWGSGHLIGLVTPDEYGEAYQNFWTFDNLPIIPSEWKFGTDVSKMKRFNVLKKLMSDPSVDEIICATDAGREGECIFRYIYNYLHCRKPVKRLWLSSMKDTAIREGMANLKPNSHYDHLYYAGLCRNKADWLVGMNGSRLFSNRYKSVLNIGRVQTPVLAMIVQRDYDVAHFVKQKFYTVELDCGDFTATSLRIDDESYAKGLAEMCNGKSACVRDIKKEIKTVNPPTLYDLNTLQREANRKYGYTAKQTLEYAQSLYEAEIISYPRTDSNYLTEDMGDTASEKIQIIQQMFSELNFGITNPDVKRCLNNKKVGEHYALFPLGIESADLNALPRGERNILFLIAARLILATAEPHKYEKVTVDISAENIDSVPFYAVGKTILENGFKELENRINGKKEKENTTALPELEVAQLFNPVTAKSAEHWTTPPKPYTEDTLLKAMETAGNIDYDSDSDVEKKGLGTPATRADIIENLVKRGYIERDEKKLIATEKGVNLISVVPDEVKSPKLTADWETYLQHIEKGQADPDSFMEKIEAFTRKLVSDYSEVDEEVDFSVNSVIGTCPRCKQNILEGKINFYCESGKDGCGFSVWKEMKYPNTKITAKKMKELLTNGKAELKAKSKEGKDYTAIFNLEDNGKYVNLVYSPDNNKSSGKCPKCRSEIKKGQSGYYCTGKCGMNVGKVFGKELTENQLERLLDGKEISYTVNKRKTVVLPEIEQNNYNGKTYYQWKVKKD